MEEEKKENEVTEKEPEENSEVTENDSKETGDIKLPIGNGKTVTGLEEAMKFVNGDETSKLFQQLRAAEQAKEAAQALEAERREAEDRLFERVNSLESRFEEISNTIKKLLIFLPKT